MFLELISQMKMRCYSLFFLSKLSNKKTAKLDEAINRAKELKELLNEVKEIRSIQEEIRNQLYDIAIHTPSKQLNILAKAYRNKGISFDSLGRHEDAIKCYDRALELEPNSNSSLLNKGVALSLLDYEEKAIEYYNQVINDLENDDVLNQKLKELKYESDELKGINFN